MSGYLQRLVASVRVPNAAVRPVLGSLFSASTPESTAESLPTMAERVLRGQPGFRGPAAPEPPQANQSAAELSRPRRDILQVETQTSESQAAADRSALENFPVEEQIAELGRPRRDILHVETQTSESQAAADRSALENFPVEEQIVVSGQAEGPRPMGEARTSFKPLMTEVPQDTGPRRKTGGEGGPKEIPIERAETRPERPEQPAFLHGPHRPFVEENLLRMDAKAFRVSSSLTYDGPRVEKPDLPSQTAQRGQEADMIQIHIGRIEVTAVPPAPARPSAQPVRKALNLGEYLKRGRGRTW